MDKELHRQAHDLNVNRKHRKSWQTFVKMLALCVVFCTSYVLVLPAITPQQQPICGQEGHVHSTECYSQPQAILENCAIPAEALVLHQHSGLCFNEAGELICPLAEKSLHTHDESCYTDTLELTCPLEEILDDGAMEHIHTEDCLVKAEPVLLCGMQEHHHEPGCYPKEEAPVVDDKYLCGIGVHSHGDRCRDESGNLVCSIP